METEYTLGTLLADWIEVEEERIVSSMPRGNVNWFKRVFIPENCTMWGRGIEVGKFLDSYLDAFPEEVERVTSILREHGVKCSDCNLCLHLPKDASDNSVLKSLRLWYDEMCVWAWLFCKIFYASTKAEITYVMSKFMAKTEDASVQTGHSTLHIHVGSFSIEFDMRGKSQEEKKNIIATVVTQMSNQRAVFWIISEAESKFGLNAKLTYHVKKDNSLPHVRQIESFATKNEDSKFGLSLTAQEKVKLIAMRGRHSSLSAFEFNNLIGDILALRKNKFPMDWEELVERGDLFNHTQSAKFSYPCPKERHVVICNALEDIFTTRILDIGLKLFRNVQKEIEQRKLPYDALKHWLSFEASNRGLVLVGSCSKEKGHELHHIPHMDDGSIGAAGTICGVFSLYEPRLLIPMTGYDDLKENHPHFLKRFLETPVEDKTFCESLDQIAEDIRKDMDQDEDYLNPLYSGWDEACTNAVNMFNNCLCRDVLKLASTPFFTQVEIMTLGKIKFVEVVKRQGDADRILPWNSQSWNKLLSSKFSHEISLGIEFETHEIRFDIPYSWIKTFTRDPSGGAMAYSRSDAGLRVVDLQGKMFTLARGVLVVEKARLAARDLEVALREHETHFLVNMLKDVQLERSQTEAKAQTQKNAAQLVKEEEEEERRRNAKPSDEDLAARAEKNAKKKQKAAEHAARLEEEREKKKLAQEAAKAAAKRELADSAIRKAISLAEQAFQLGDVKDACARVASAMRVHSSNASDQVKEEAKQKRLEFTNNDKSAPAPSPTPAPDPTPQPSSQEKAKEEEPAEATRKGESNSQRKTRRKREKQEAEAQAKAEAEAQAKAKAEAQVEREKRKKEEEEEKRKAQVREQQRIILAKFASASASSSASSSSSSNVWPSLPSSQRGKGGGVSGRGGRGGRGNGAAFSRPSSSSQSDHNEDDADNSCVVCMDMDSTHVSVPCGHMCLCEGCVRKLQAAGDMSCPTCRQPTMQFMRVYM